MDNHCWEAAAVSGETKKQSACYIRLPFLKTTIVLIVLLQTGKIFNADYGMFYFLPRNSGTLYRVTDVIDNYVYRAFRDTGDIGMASAMGLFQTLAGFATLYVINVVIRKIDRDNALF